MKFLAIATAALLGAATLSAQNNLVKNPSFESPTLAPWTLRSSVGKVQVSFPQKAKVGAIEDRALQVKMGNVGSSIYAIGQEIVLPHSGWYQLSLSGRRISGNGSVTLDLVAASTGWTWGPRAVTQNHFVSVGRPVRLTKGKLRCALWLRNQAGSAFTAQIDEIVVRPIQMPGMVFDNTRIYAYDVTDRHFLVAYASFQRLSKPITIPGWKGGFDLDPFRPHKLIYVGIGVSDPGRIATLVLLPPSVHSLGRTVFFQPVDVTGRVFGSRLALRWRP
ncbi:MAG: hypothetical protein CSA62_06445 [Planctomycetota bacterium]|nr:MAG: hypothetical protein CSA62_06445 [Planctomycetota bacterium]